MGPETACRYLFHEFGFREANHRVKSHVHKAAWHFDIILKGNAEFLHEGDSINLAEWDSVLISAGIPHAFNYGKNPVSYISVKFACGSSVKLTSPTLLARDGIGTPIVNALTMYLQNSRMPSLLERRIIGSLLSAIVAVAQMDTQKEASSFITPFESACGFIETRINKAVSVHDVALHIGYSSRYVNMLFGKRAHCSAKAYVDRKRAEHCREYLLHSALSIKEVAHKLHFSSINAFSRFFRRHFGMSPREFRKKMSAYG